MSEEVLKIVLNQKVYFEIKVKAVSKEVNDEKFDLFTKNLTNSIADLLISHYTNGMEVMH